MFFIRRRNFLVFFLRLKKKILFLSRKVAHPFANTYLILSSQPSVRRCTLRFSCICQAFSSVVYLIVCEFFELTGSESVSVVFWKSGCWAVLFLCLSVFLFVCFCIDLFVYLSVLDTKKLSVYRFFCLFVFVSICLFIGLYQILNFFFLRSGGGDDSSILYAYISWFIIIEKYFPWWFVMILMSSPKLFVATWANWRYKICVLFYRMVWNCILCFKCLAKFERSLMLLECIKQAN